MASSNFFSDQTASFTAETFVLRAFGTGTPYLFDPPWDWESHMDGADGPGIFVYVYLNHPVGVSWLDYRLPDRAPRQDGPGIYIYITRTESPSPRRKIAFRARRAIGGDRSSWYHATTSNLELRVVRRAEKGPIDSTKWKRDMEKE